MEDIRVQRKTVNLIIIFIWKEVYVVGQVDADSSGKSDDLESDNVKRRDRRGYIDLILYIIKIIINWTRWLNALKICRKPIYTTTLLES